MFVSGSHPEYEDQVIRSLALMRRSISLKPHFLILFERRRYVKETSGEKKRYRQYPTTYLNQHTWNDEITKQDKRIEIEEYKHDTERNKEHSKEEIRSFVSEL